ncbi:MAG TPA: EsaB/YukD family protein [Ktedonobacteraceae bacterium]|nr:EsaB/YukD family protein [Ktedonobacteraceae bacterium]
MQTVLLTIVSAQRIIDLKLPAEVPIGDLMPRIRELCGISLPDGAEPAKRLSWHLLLPSSGKTLDAGRSLNEAGIIDGAILLLRNTASIGQLSTPVFQPKIILPSEESGGIGVRWYVPRE